MKFELDIDCNNAAFEGDPTYQVADLLIQTAKNLRENADVATEGLIVLRDANGSIVGRARFTQEFAVDDREFLQDDHDEDLS